MSPELARQIDLWVSVAGAVVTALFCGFLAVLISRARREVKSDRWLAGVMGVFFVICAYAVVRYVTDLVRIPFATSAIWIIAIIVEAITVISLFEEMAAVRAVRKAEEEAAIRLDARLDAKLEPSVKRNEIAADRTEAAASRVESAIDGG